METINVTIYNSEYKLRGDDTDGIKKAAALVDEQMKYVATKAPMQSVTTTAVLAALNTAEMLLVEKSRSGEQVVSMVEKIDRLSSNLEGLVAGSNT